MYSYNSPFEKVKYIMGKSILVVDDDPGILEALKVMLEDQGYSVETASNGNIIQILDEANLPSMIILDVMLSGMDGRVIAEKLRKKKETKEIPIVMISANPYAATDCVKRGANAFLAKPFEIDDLLTVVHKYVPVG